MHKMQRRLPFGIAKEKYHCFRNQRLFNSSLERWIEYRHFEMKIRVRHKEIKRSRTPALHSGPAASLSDQIHHALHRDAGTWDRTITCLSWPHGRWNVYLLCPLDRDFQWIPRVSVTNMPSWEPLESNENFSTAESPEGLLEHSFLPHSRFWFSRPVDLHVWQAPRRGRCCPLGNTFGVALSMAHKIEKWKVLSE